MTLAEGRVSGPDVLQAIGRLGLDPYEVRDLRAADRLRRCVGGCEEREAGHTGFPPSCSIGDSLIWRPPWMLHAALRHP